MQVLLADDAFHAMVSEILTHGTPDANRTDVSAIARIGHSYRVDCGGNKPVLQISKTVYTGTALKELEWFMSGDTRLDPLIALGVHIWDQWVIPGTEKYDADGELVGGDLGPIYQHQWRNWTKEYSVRGEGARRRWHDRECTATTVTSEILKDTHGGYVTLVKETYDQLQIVTKRLRSHPDCRRHIVSAWNPGDISDMALPPCHVMFQFCSRPVVPTLVEMGSLLTWSADASAEDILDEEFISRCVGEPRKLDLVLYMRSNDVGVGHAFNAFQYSTMLITMARAVGMLPGEFIFMGANVHLYENQQEAYQEQRDNLITRKYHEILAMDPVRLVYTTPKVANALLDFKHTDVKLENYTAVSTVRYPIAAK